MKKILITIYLFALILSIYSLFTMFYPNSEYTYSFLNNYFSETSYSFIYPTNFTEVSSDYGYRYLLGTSNFHDGIDFLAPQGSNVIASSSGYVSYASFMQGYGNTVIITHDNNIQTLYGHLDENFNVHVGQNISQGQVIGKVGPKYLSNGMLNGNTTGPHLHFTIFKDNSNINPRELLNK